MSLFTKCLRPSMPAARRSIVRFNSTSTPAKIREIVEASTNDKELVSGAPAELSYSDKRVARIYKEAKYATQSSSRNSKFWKVEFDIVARGNRWENDLIGYQGTSDYLQCTRLNFDTKDDAVRFAEGQGWNYYVQEPKERKFKPKQYASNFVHINGPLKLIRTK
ncbi:DEKNAAC105554 [Brettanomyces naardenensis]|uniref:NADH dehydrogenase [ubiquinone] iron-sulfur protein 4, mitochondrial n=1 Tax=Brettanomyces naardenensis TaxID=13370 RepID=A0A448YTQ9_BRENA|nr:DEKNAAC105554 [Brettanomyces naardenensis]